MTREDMISSTSTNAVREAYIRHRTRHLDDLDGVVRFFEGASFDMWLQGELARVWDEGFDEASDDLGKSQMMADMGQDLNPYRRTE